ncbi:zinc-binding dehydrogenase [Candidatus Bathyarchaeota archaeon]|nr:zinc-binding dehydrogenase [Candidatus Bathyarchaeota archaeon]
MEGFRVVFRAPKLVDVEGFEVKPPKSGRLLVRTICSLISPGTETAFLMALENTSRVFPQYPGYSNIGIVAEVGNGAAEFKPGDIVASSSSHASHVYPKAEECFKVPESLSPMEASFFNLGMIALQGVRKSRIELGEPAVVLGLGLIGQMASQLLRLDGALPVSSIDTLDNRLMMAKELGADYVLNLSKIDIEGEVKRLTDGKGARVVIDATGHPDAIGLAFKLASMRGRVVLLGSTRGLSTVNFYRDVHRKGLLVIGAHNSIRPSYESYEGYWTRLDDGKTIFKLMAKGMLRCGELISRVVKATEAAEAYRLLIEEKDKVLGVLLDWSR